MTDQPALPEFWTNDLATARASLARLAAEHGIALPSLMRAADQVEECHRGQFRKGSEAPYAVHPIRLACSLIASLGVEDVEALCAALLHDVLEDTKTTQAQLANDFGARCAELVAVVSRSDEERRPPEGDSIESTYLRRIRDYGEAAILIKLADKIDNLRDAVSHPDRNRVSVFVNETFPAYLPLARALSDEGLAARAERLLLEAAGRTGGVQNPRFLNALLDLVSRSDDVPFPATAVRIHCFLNPHAKAWLEYDGVAITRETLPPRELATRVASALRRNLTSPELSHLLLLAGIPPAFAAPSNDALWTRAASRLERLQRLLTAADLPPWLAVLVRDENAPLLLALIQSCIYLPASWRSPLWSAGLGAAFSERVRDISGSSLPSLALSHRLALTRYADGTGTFARAARVFEKQPFDDEALWAFRLGFEALEAENDLWAEVHDKPFSERSMPDRTHIIGAPAIETIGVRETRALFPETQFDEIVGQLIDENPDWIVFDHDEWRKRRPRWSIDTGAEVARVIRRTFGAAELLTVLPARKYALQDRLPEMTGGELEAIARGDYTAVAMFDTLLAKGTLWTPRVYRILDTIEDLDPDGVQALTVDYETSGESIPGLRAFLPLPANDAEAQGQDERKQTIARYLVAQIYSCGLVRNIQRARLSCSAVAESRREYAFTEAGLQEAIATAEKNHGFRAPFGPYIERYRFDPFGVTTGQSETVVFGPDEMRRGTYAGVDIGAQFVKIAVARGGQLLENPSHREVATPGGMTVSQFCKEIIDSVGCELQDLRLQWGDLDGLGISWPGAVRDNRIVGISKTLQNLDDDGATFSPGDPINRLSEFDFLERFRTQLPAVKENFMLSLINDGDAEAFGNHALRTLKGIGKPGGKIIVKLGTSLAGGRITAAGALAEDVAEFAKVIIILPPADATVPWPYTTRDYVSAIGVRNLCRTFRFDGAPLFPDGVIEPIEAGQLLPLVVDDGKYLEDLVRTDNQGTSELIARVVERTAASLPDSDALRRYIETRGLRRTVWLCTGEEGHSIPYDALARTVAGSVALFSQLGLHVAHLIAHLYNIYRRGTFSEVVLAGGVLSARTGEIVETQAKGFLRKYYDKIYGDGDRPLGPDTLVRAGFEGISNPGVFGAAMAASRRWQADRDHLLRRRIEEQLRRIPIGKEVALKELLAVADDASSRDHALRLIERHFATGAIARAPGGRIQKIA